MGRRRRQERRQERKEDRQLGTRRGGGTRYKMRQKMVAIGDDFWIEDDQGQKAFKVDGKALRVRDTLKFEDAHGNEVCKIQERRPRIPHWRRARQGRRGLEKCFRLRDSYGVSIDPDQNDTLILAITVCIDQMAHEGR